jgi:hypothetical protein
MVEATYDQARVIASLSMSKEMQTTCGILRTQPVCH